MHLFKSSHVQIHEMQEVLDCLPADFTGLDRAATLQLWRQWHQRGSLTLSRVDAIGGDGRRQLKALGATLWLTDRGTAALTQASTQSCVHRVYAAEQDKLAWVMQTSEVEQAHDTNKLNLMVLHFWSAVEVGSADFQPIFIQAHSLFRDTYQGFGVQQLLQEVPASNAPILKAAGMHAVEDQPDEMQNRLVLMRIRAEDASANPGSTFSFLFFSPRRRLNLKPAVQRMLQLALRQLTDDEIAEALGYSRDYVRKLWNDAYARMEGQGALRVKDTSAASSMLHPINPKRGRERRRLALEFLRANVQELRPGLPCQT